MPDLAPPPGVQPARPGTPGVTGSALARLSALAVLWGSSFLFIKVGIEGLSPSQLVLGRLLTGASVLAAIVVVRRERLPRRRVVWVHLALLGVVGNIAPFLLFAWGEQRASSSLAGIYNASTPLLTLLMAIVALPEERPNAARATGLVLGFLGVLTVLAPWQGVGGGGLAGQVALVAASVCYGVSFVYTRRYLSGTGHSPLARAGRARVRAATGRLPEDAVRPRLCRDRRRHGARHATAVVPGRTGRADRGTGDGAAARPARRPGVLPADAAQRGPVHWLGHLRASDHRRVGAAVGARDSALGLRRTRWRADHADGAAAARCHPGAPPVRRGGGRRRHRLPLRPAAPARDAGADHRLLGGLLGGGRRRHRGGGVVGAAGQRLLSALPHAPGGIPRLLPRLRTDAGGLLHPGTGVLRRSRPQCRRCAGRLRRRTA